METPRLQIPHPRIRNRPFVLFPLLEIDSALRDPISGKSYRVFLDNQKEKGILGRFFLPEHGIANG